MDTTILLDHPSRRNAIRRKKSSPGDGHIRPICLRGILVVEDDAAIRSFLRTILLSESYRVFEADSAAEAARIWKSNFC